MKKNWGKYVFGVIVIAVVMAVCWLWLYAIINYGGKTITEIPSWAIPFIVGRRAR